MADKKYELRTLFWETTLRCNAGCEFCGSSCSIDKSCEGELSTEEVSAALKDIAQKLESEKIMINVTGGEPLLRRDLFGLMELASELGFSWGMVSNGSLINPDIIRKMKASRMKTLTVSIDGTRETHESLRRLFGCYDRIINSLKEIKYQGFLDHLQVTTVVSKKNINGLEALREILLDIGLDSWRVITVDPIGRARDNYSLLLDGEDMEKYTSFMKKYRNDLKLPTVKSCSHFFGEWEKDVRDYGFTCGAGTRVASILYNGDIFVCPNVERRPQLIQGNVRNDSLADLWDRGFGYFRRYDRGSCSQCKSCYYRSACAGDSLHTWDFENERPVFCIKDYYGSRQKSSLDAKEKLYNEVVSSAEGRASALRIFPDRSTYCKVVFTKNAARELLDFFEWGMDTKRNRNELMACLIGRRERDFYAVRAVKETELAYADETSAVYTKETFFSAVRALDEIQDGSSEIVGFIHSHPCGLDTVVSTADTELHEYLSGFGIELSMLINPQKKKIVAYYGKDLELSEILLLR